MGEKPFEQLVLEQLGKIDGTTRVQTEQITQINTRLGEMRGTEVVLQQSVTSLKDTSATKADVKEVRIEMLPKKTFKIVLSTLIAVAMVVGLLLNWTRLATALGGP